MSNPRIFLDLKREPRRSHWFRFAGCSFLIQEPTIHHIEKTIALTGVEYPFAHEFLKFIDWNEENLEDIISFCESLPIGLMDRLLKVCREAFERPENITADMLKEVVEPIGEGIVRSLTEKAVSKNRATATKKAEDYLLEYLGVIVKPKPKKHKSEEENERPTEGWMPLTGVMDPVAYNKLKKSLAYDPELFDEDIEKEVQDRINSLNENKSNNEKERRSHAYGGQTGVSLMYAVDKGNFAQLFHQMNRGFYQAYTDGVDLKTYTKSAETLVNPVALKNRQDLKDVVPEEEPEIETVKISSRWKAKKG